MPEKTENNEKEFLLGGQAVIEGVMMRSPNYYTVAVRKPDGNIVVQQKHKPKVSEKHKWLGWPFIRGVAALGQSLSIGMGALNFSAEVAIEEEEGKDGEKAEFGGWAMFGVVAFAIIFAVLLVVVLPLFLTDITIHLIPALDNPIGFNTVDGIFRVLAFLSYILSISLMPDIKRVFQYHGAEHMAVYASEKEKEITVENSKKYSPYHPRCGTSFLLLVMLVSIVVFSFTPHKGEFLIRLLIRTPLIPVIAGVSYEVLRATAKVSEHKLFCVLSAPGMLLQRLTAKHPDEKQLEVSVTALNRVMALEEELDGKPVPQDQEEIILTPDT
jgi:uncharacterized protein YqhQ